MKDDGAFARSARIAVTVVATLSGAALVLLWTAILGSETQSLDIAGGVAATVMLVASVVFAFVAVNRPTAALRRSVGTFRTFSRTSPAAHAIVTANHTIVEWNPAANRIFGRPDDEDVTGQRLEDVIPAPLVQATIGAVDDVIGSGTARPLTATLELGGRRISIDGSLFPTELEHGLAGVGAILWDVTELQDRRRSAEGRRNLLDAVINSAQEGIISVDAESGAVVTFNGGAENLFGISAAEATRASVETLLTLNNGQSLDSVLQEEQQAGIRGTGHRANGTTFVARGSVSTLVYEDRQMLVLVIRDASEGIARQEALRAAREEAERANAAKTQFLARMSHELRTPLNVVLGFAQVMQLDEDLPDQHKASIAHIRSAGRQLVDLVDDVLDMSDIEAGQVALNAEPIGVEELVAEIVELMAPVATEQRILLETDSIPGSLSLTADRHRLGQVLVNVVDNGIKYNVEGGLIRISARAENSDVVIAVRDTGPGIEPEMLGRVFEPFDRLGADTSEIGGTGLALALSRALVEAMSGSMGVESTPGEGSTFWIRLPRSDSTS